MSNKEVREVNRVLLQRLRRMGGPINESGHPTNSEAVAMIKSGWQGIGYLLLAPKPSSQGHLYGAKRVAHDVSSAKELDAWFRTRVGEGFTPVFRYYLSDSPSTASSNKKYMMGEILHEEASCGYTVLMEAMLNGAPAFKEINAYLSQGLLAPDIAKEFAFLVDMGKMGARFIHTRSTVEVEPEVMQTGHIPISRMAAPRGPSPRR